MKKIDVGASVYVGLKEYPLEKNIEYLNLLKEVGITYVFISAHIPEMSEGFTKELEEVLSYASSIGLRMVVDISKNMYDKITLPKIYALRLDYGFSKDDIVNMYKMGKFKLEFNASTISRERLLELERLGVNLSDVRLSHNFYPKVYTGLSRDFVRTKNKEFNELGIDVNIFIPSSNQKRPPMYEGLPTIEEHRTMDLDAVLSEVESLGASGVIFSDSYASREELIKAINFDYDVAVIPLKLFTKVTEEERFLLEKLHQNRTDATSYFVRSSVRSAELIEPSNTIDRRVGYVTIDNHLMKRYMGEVCIMLKDLEKDERVNVLGEVLCPIDTLLTIGPSRKFRFKIVE